MLNIVFNLLMISCFHSHFKSPKISTRNQTLFIKPLKPFSDDNNDFFAFLYASIYAHIQGL